MDLKIRYIAVRLSAFLGKSWVQETCNIVFSLLIFSLILINRSPNPLRPLSLSLRAGFTIAIPIFAFFLYVSFRLHGWVGRLLSLTLTLALFAFALAGLWATGQSQSTIFNGIVPLLDASEYYVDALRLLAGGDFSVISAHRPLFPGLLAVLLGVTGHNLMVAFGILTALTAVACYLAAREVQRTHGAEAAVLVLIILFLFYRFYSGSAMTENLGVPLGALGFALIWRGAAEHKRITVWLGLFVSTLALNARAGAFFVLPFLLLWGGWAFRESGRRISWRFLGVGSGIVLAGFVVNLMMFRLLATPSGVPFGNFSYHLYGLASGGESWVYVRLVHPEVLDLQEPERSRMIYRLAFDLIRQNPALLVQGALHNWSMLVSSAGYNVYAYVGGENTTVNLAVRWGLYLLCVLGLLKWFCKPKDVLVSLVVIAALGVLLSVPFVPPTDVQRMRPYAASMMILGLMPGMGLVFILENLKTGFFCKPVPGYPGRGMTTWFSLLLVGVILIGPLIIKGIVRPPKFGSVSCEPGTELVITRFDPGTFFNVIPKEVIKPDKMPDFHVSRFKRNAHSLPDGRLVRWALRIIPPKSFFYGLDYQSNEKVLITAPGDMLPEPGEVLAVCGTFDKDQRVEKYRIFYARSVKVLAP